MLSSVSVQVLIISNIVFDFQNPLKKFGKSHEENLKIESLHFHEIFLPNVDSI